MRRNLAILLSALALLLVPLAPAQAIVNGVPDDNAHPYVGEVLFYVPDEVDPRFSDPGAWFSCSATLLNRKIVLTAGHCTYGVGRNGEPTTPTGGSGGNDIWVDFSEAPDFSILPPSSTFAPNDNAGRYKAWSTALNASDEWHRATAFPHPEFDPNAFFTHDMGVLRLAEPVTMDQYGQLPTPGLIDTLARNHRATYTTVGYGLERSTPHASFGGDTRRKATVTLVNTQGVYGTGKGTAVKWSGNKGRPHTGGTCFGDSGGPTFPNAAGMERIVLTVTSFGINANCAGGGGGYRIDQPDDLAFLATFGVRP
jgi:Trypsin